MFSVSDGTAEEVSFIISTTMSSQSNRSEEAGPPGLTAVVSCPPSWLSGWSLCSLQVHQAPPTVQTHALNGVSSVPLRLSVPETCSTQSNNNEMFTVVSKTKTFVRLWKSRSFRSVCNVVHEDGAEKDNAFFLSSAQTDGPTNVILRVHSPN